MRPKLLLIPVGRTDRLQPHLQEVRQVAFSGVPEEIKIRRMLIAHAIEQGGKMTPISREDATSLRTGGKR